MDAMLILAQMLGLIATRVMRILWIDVWTDVMDRRRIVALSLWTWTAVFLGIRYRKRRTHFPFSFYDYVISITVAILAATLLYHYGH